MSSSEAARATQRDAPSWTSLFADPGRAGPLIIAHRGDSSHAPENTLEAARRGWESGAHAWELDVHLARDGVPVVIHDESLLRTTDVAQKFARDPRAARGFPVAHFALDEIRTLDAGSWFLDPAGRARSAADFGTLGLLGDAARAAFASGSVKVPTLAEALELTRALDWLVNVELKLFPNCDFRLLDAVLDVIAQTATGSRVLISSFDHAEVARCVRHPRGRAPATGVLTVTPLYRAECYVRDTIGAGAYHPSAEALGAFSDAYLRAPSPGALRHRELAALKEHRVPVLVYTVNDSAPDGLAAHLFAAGANGLFTDDPAGMRRLLDQTIALK